MKTRLLWIAVGVGIGLVSALYLSRSRDVVAQQSERPGNSIDPPIEMPHDLSGLSIKNPRVRVVHTTDPDLEGGSMYLQQVDPFLAYQWGRSLTQRNFRDRDAGTREKDGRARLARGQWRDGRVGRASFASRRRSLPGAAVCCNVSETFRRSPSS